MSIPSLILDKICIASFLDNNVAYFAIPKERIISSFTLSLALSNSLAFLSCFTMYFVTCLTCSIICSSLTPKVFWLDIWYIEPSPLVFSPYIPRIEIPRLLISLNILFINPTFSSPGK